MMRLPDDYTRIMRRMRWNMLRHSVRFAAESFRTGRWLGFRRNVENALRCVYGIVIVGTYLDRRSMRANTWERDL